MASILRRQCPTQFYLCRSTSWTTETRLDRGALRDSVNLADAQEKVSIPQSDSIVDVELAVVGHRRIEAIVMAKNFRISIVAAVLQSMGVFGEKQP